MSEATVDASIADEELAKQKRRTRIQAIVAIVVIVLIFGVLLPQLIDYGEVWKAMKRLSFTQLLILMVLALMLMS